MPTERRLERMRSVLRNRQPDLQVVVDNIHDAHNASAILRTCDGLGAAAVNFIYTDQEPPKISDGVAGYARKWLDLSWFSDPAECVDALHQSGVKLYVTHIDESATDFRRVDWTEPSAIAFGNEHRGCTPELVSLADETIQIPMAGMAQSFNVSVSAAIVLAEASRQRLEAGMYDSDWNDWRQEQLDRWLARDEPWISQ